MPRVLFALMLLTGCISTANDNPSETTTVRGTLAPKETVDLTRDIPFQDFHFAAPREDVWNALMAAHDALGIPFTGGDLKQGVATFQLANQIRTVAGKSASRYIDCGNGPAGARADSYRLVIKLTHMLDANSGEGTRLRTAMEAWARNPGISSDPVACSSRGLLEREIGGMVATRLQ